jgi:hypothetical protein
MRVEIVFKIINRRKKIKKNGIDVKSRRKYINSPQHINIGRNTIDSTNQFFIKAFFKLLLKKFIVDIFYYKINLNHTKPLKV